jgi:hypothetical protein
MKPAMIFSRIAGNRSGRSSRRRRRRTGTIRRSLARIAAAPRAVLLAIVLLPAFAGLNLVYHVARKPTELLFPAEGALAKTPAETWREYGALFRRYATDAVPPALLAALAQAEGAGDPLARTYWRWRLSWNPFAIYQPASSAVGMYQMTDAAFADARPYCIRDHVVAERGCWFGPFYSRLVPSHAVELTAISLDRQVAAILARRSGPAATARQKEALAAAIHLCGAGPARRFARRGFHPLEGERCGDHDLAAYLTRIDALQRTFRRLAAD